MLVFLYIQSCHLWQGCSVQITSAGILLEIEILLTFKWTLIDMIRNSVLHLHLFLIPSCPASILTQDVVQSCFLIGDIKIQRLCPFACRDFSWAALNSFPPVGATGWLVRQRTSVCLLLSPHVLCCCPPDTSGIPPICTSTIQPALCFVVHLFVWKGLAVVCCQWVQETINWGVQGGKRCIKHTHTSPNVHTSHLTA